MEFKDRTLNCSDCGQEFTFTAGEQEFYSSKGFENDPKRCPDCRNERKRDKKKKGGAKTLYKVTCAECGQESEVPFEPTQGKPVLCRDCFENSKSRRPRRERAII